MDLREAVLQVARHFINVEPKLNNIILIADYTMDSHARDHDNYVNVSRTRKRRAKALLGSNLFLLYHDYIIWNKKTHKYVDPLTDFERHDDDELGFRKNDIITIISQKDEHCWVGELNGLRGNVYLTFEFSLTLFSFILWPSTHLQSARFHSMCLSFFLQPSSS